MTICESRTLPPSWIRWNSQNIHALHQNARLHLPERDRGLAKYRDGSSQYPYGITSLQNSGLGCLSVELDVFTVGKLDDPRCPISLCATVSGCYCAKGDDFIMWRCFPPARNMRISHRTTNICTAYFFGHTWDIMYKVLDASALCTLHRDSTLRSISCRPPTAARTRHRA
ncbi:hypothetical protein BD626DRAFT_478622 [Schizophyllum amplum]|uniref:Uncharacterized protein n=1 Tax=Schizophyllum amplum TaxID=97359 RepID=A0A550CRE2_9AGAR|nr:hypothetical protein BD626DRAFT_478567 [Auriculariopsis ampla]TRM67367.1 hypothetical protein BD626DRAFT_478622 [Auriculariopsis ampla]